MNHKNEVPNFSDIHRLRDAFVAGDDGAYSNLYEMYARNMYSFGLSLHAKKELIEDAMHDIFVAVFSRRQNLAKVQNLKLYFMVAFRNRLFFLMKREVIYTEITDRYSQMFAEKNYMDMWIENECVSEKELLVERLVSELSPHQREAVYHRFVEGLSLEEIAVLMNINYQSVKNLIYRSTKKLRML